MTFGIETHRSFVNTWECDENAHLNVQFYWKRFGQAARIFTHRSQQPQQDWIDRHVRYHRELLVSANTIIETAPIANQSLTVHLMSNGETGDIAATAVDSYQNCWCDSPFEIETIPDPAMPRSLPAEPLEPIEPETVIADGLGLVTHRSIIESGECDENGRLSDQHHIARFSDAAPHFWLHLGVSRSLMHKKNLGSVAVEMKVTRHQPAMVSMPIQVTTWLHSVSEKSFSFRHQINDISTGEPLFSGAATALMIDIETRKLAPLPEAITKLL